MSDLISRQRAIDAIDECAETANDNYEYQQEQGLLKARALLIDLPSARKRGKWIVLKDKEGHTYGKCSACGMTQYAGMLNYCPTCGADMRGEEDEAD